MASPLALLRLRRSSVAALLLLAYVPACTSWQVGPPPPETFLQREQPRRVRVTRIDGTELILTAPSLRGDTLIGNREGVDSRGEPALTQVAVPLSQVQSLAVNKFSAGKTALLVGGAVGVLLLVWVIQCSGKSGWESLGCP